MTRKVSCLIPFLFALATSSSVFFDYNKIATRMEIGMDCRVNDPEERSSIHIHQNNRKMVTITSGCSIKSNDSRLRISCIETENAILISVNMSGYALSDLGTWNCSDGRSYDTVTFQNFIRNTYYREMRFNCIVHQECNLFLWMMFMFTWSETNVTTIDGKVLLRKVEHGIIIDDKWRGRIIINDDETDLNVTILDVDISDAGIYYILNEWFMRGPSGFIITITDYPKQPVILLRSQETMSKGGLYELYCASESKSYPVFTRKQLSFTWKINGHNLTEFQPCFRLSGPILTLCTDACGLRENDNFSISCTANEDGLNSNESEPFIVSASRVTSARSARDMDNMDHRTERATWILVGACLCSFIIGILLCSSLKFLVNKRCAVCRKEHRDEERSTDILDDTPHVNTFMMIHAMPEGELPSRNTDDMLYVNSIMVDTHIANEGQIKQYEALDHSSVEDRPNQYDVVQSTRSGHNSKEDTYEDI